MPKPPKRTVEPFQEPPPRAGSATSIASGEVLYNRFCARCHVFGDGLLPDLRRLSAPTHQLLYDIVLNGAYRAKGMGRWDDVLSRADAESIHDYLVDQAWAAYEHQHTAVPASGFVLASGDPELGAKFPVKYTLNDFGCTGGNQSPPLRWSGAPEGTLSFVVTLFDMDEHNTPSGWWHWVVYNLPADAAELRAGAGVVDSKALPKVARQGRTDLGTDAYHGPCPNKGDEPHRYVFTIYALNVAELAVPPEPSGAMVVYALQEHLLGKATLVVRRGR